jgi:heme/copper-type cytochrome/quinol oxidase subunit 1
MQSKIKLFLKEFIWLILLLGLTILLSFLLFGVTVLTGSVDLHLHDTYIIISSWQILTPIYFLLVFVFYLIKEKRQSFARPLPNWLILISGLTLIIIITCLVQTFSQLMTGWTLYPPLSGLGNSVEPEITISPIAKFIATFLTVLQLFISIALFYFAFIWGKRVNRQI